MAEETGRQADNLLKGTAEASSDRYSIARYTTATPLVVGRNYTISAYVEELSRSGSDSPAIAVYDGGDWWTGGKLHGDVPGVQSLTFQYRQPFEGHADASSIVLYNTPPNGGSSVKRGARLRDVMLVEGTTPVAWAPAAGEPIEGGGDR